MAVGLLFFGLLGAGRLHDFVGAAEWTALVTVALLACAFVVGFWLPRRAREMAAPDSPATAVPGSPTMPAREPVGMLEPAVAR